MNIQREGLIVFAGVGGALLLATLVNVVLRMTLQGEKSKPLLDDLSARIKGWWVMVIVIGGALLAGRNAVILLFAFVSFAALREFITLTPTRQADRGALLLSFFVALPMQYGLIWDDWYGLFTILIPVYGFLILPITAVLFADSKNFLARTSEAQLGLMISVYCISHVPALLTLNIPGYQ